MKSSLSEEDHGNNTTKPNPLHNHLRYHSEANGASAKIGFISESEKKENEKSETFLCLS